VRIFSKEGGLTYNLTNKAVEESDCKEELTKRQSVMDQLVDKCVKFSLLNERLVTTALTSKEENLHPMTGDQTALLSTSAVG
jgi:hypothetical protein